MKAGKEENQLAKRKVYSQKLTGIDQDIVRCQELHQRVAHLLASRARKDFASPA